MKKLKQSYYRLIICCMLNTVGVYIMYWERNWLGLIFIVWGVSYILIDIIDLIERKMRKKNEPC